MMVSSEQIFKETPIFKVFFFVLICLALCVGSCSAATEKVNTTLSIITDPVDPGEDLPFTVSGLLTDAEGNVMGNKKVTLEQLQFDDPEGDYEFLAIANTDIDGTYSFLRPEAAPPEYLRVRYNGNAQFEGTVSAIIPGHIAKEPQVTAGIVPSVVKAKTVINAKASPSNPSPGQSVTITGQLLGENGTPLAGKKVICEASDRIGNMADYSILGISPTDENGFFKFGVGGGSTTTFIQIHFAGDKSYEESYSNLITVL